MQASWTTHALVQFESWYDIPLEDLVCTSMIGLPSSVSWYRVSCCRMTADSGARDSFGQLNSSCLYLNSKCMLIYSSWQSWLLCGTGSHSVEWQLTTGRRTHLDSWTAAVCTCTYLFAPLCCLNSLSIFFINSIEWYSRHISCLYSEIAESTVHV